MAWESPSRQTWMPLAAIFTAGLVHFWLGMRHNDFHFQQHPDETGKIEQVIEDTRNFHHPLLLVNGLEAAARIQAPFLAKRFESRHWLAKRYSPQDLAQLGRTLSAAYVAIGIALGALSLAIAGRPWAGVAAAVFLSLDQTLVWSAHFLKEDAPLIFGIGLYLFTAARLIDRPGRWRFAGLGVAGAVLLSAKWAGGLVIVGHIIGLASFRDTRQLLRGFGWTAGAFLLGFAAINYQLWGGWLTASASFHGEMDRLAAGREGDSWLRDYRFWYLDLTTYEPGTLILLATVPGIAFALSSRLGPAPRTAFFALLGYTIFLGFTPIPSQRYFVPAAFMVLYFAGLGLGYAIEIVQKSAHRRLALTTLAAYFVGASALLAHRTRLQDQEFTLPALPAAWTWIRENLGGKPVVLAQIGRLCLPGQARVADPEASSLGVELRPIDDRTATYDSLKAEGVTHLIFRAVDRTRGLRGNGADPTLFESLDSRGHKVHEVPPGGVHIIQPGIEIYEIR